MAVILQSAMKLVFSSGARCAWPRCVRVPQRAWGGAPAYDLPSVRCVGTQTPLWRVRQEAATKASAAIAARQAQMHPACDGQLVPAGEALESAESLVAKAHSAAVNGNGRECLVLVWSLKDLPRDQAARRALNRPLLPLDAAKGGGGGGGGGLAAGSPISLLQAAAAAGMHASVELLLELGAKTCTKDEQGRTALHMAIENNFAMVARLLLARGRAHVDARDALGRTPLRLAADRGHTSAGRTLMYFGATIDAKASDGLTPLQAAKEQKGSKLGAFLEKHSKLMRKRSDEAGIVRKKSHIVAPKLVLTPVGYCPEEDGKVIQLKRGIRCNKSRSGPSSPKCIVNWYSPRG